MEITEAERVGDDARLQEAIHATKDAQNLLGAVIDLSLL
jgi:hypothetical protein